MEHKIDLRRKKKTKNGSHGHTDVFENIEDASIFWKSLWETRGTGNNNTEWLQEIKQAISRKVQSTADQDWMLETEVLVKVVLKKRNFSAPGPERLVNFWWKRARCHEAIMRAFKAISEVNEAYPLWFAKGKTRLIPKQKTV